MSVKLLTEHHLELLSLKGGCTGSSESTHGKMPHCWKSQVTARVIVSIFHINAALVSEYLSHKCSFSEYLSHKCSFSEYLTHKCSFSEYLSHKCSFSE